MLRRGFIAVAIAAAAGLAPKRQVIAGKDRHIIEWDGKKITGIQIWTGVAGTDLSDKRNWRKA